MHRKFDHREIEKKWQETWRTDGIYAIGERDLAKEKEYVLVEWPYPSGNLHIGHWYAFAVPDIYVRHQRMTGKQVIYPIGFDAFGLPAENAAIKRDLDPREWTEQNIAYMKGQLESMGNAFSWDKTTSSTDPEYFRWTQWMFARFFENDIAYRGKGMVNWCPSCNTVLANEQVTSDDTCERCGSKVEKREMDEWKMRITNYADRLVDDLEKLDWPHAIKESQRHWIGRSKGARLTFTLSNEDPIDVFTTRPDTLFGATYLVLAPEHPLVQKLPIANRDKVDAYTAASKEKDEFERTNIEKDKTGVQLEGVTATNPANGESIPVFISDYVLMGYGTGAIMAVPAHDERDFEFAQKFDLKCKCVVNPSIVSYSGSNKIGERPNITKKLSEIHDAILKGEIVSTTSGNLINSGEFDGMNSEEAKEAITKKVGGKMTNTYRLRDWSVGRQRYWGVPIPIVYDPDGMPHAIPAEHLPWHLPTDVDFRPTGEPPLAKSKELKERVVAIFGPGWTPEVETMDTFVDSSWYFLRYLDNANEDELASLETQKSWMPIDIYFGGAEHTTMHLLYSRFWQKALFDLGLVTVDEPYTKRINRGLVLGPDGNKMSKSKGNVIDPDEQVERLGADTVKMYLAFMGPYGETANYPWDLGGIAGIRRFLERVNGLREHVIPQETEEMTRQFHQMLQKVSSDIPVYKFNTAISSMMKFINLAEEHGIGDDTYSTFLKTLAPFAPHLTEELWHACGNATSIHLEAYPQHDPAIAKDDAVTIGVQVDGKVRGSVTIAVDASEEEARTAAEAEESVQKYMVGKEVKKVIYVPNRILNLITG